MIERTISFTSDGHRLVGTVTLPGTPGPHPGAVLVTGSGPIDRDSNMKRQPIAVTRDLAHHLANAGIASLRYDKRGIGESEGDYHATGFHDNVNAASAAVSALAAETELTAMFAVGHSEGALIATRLAATGAPIDGAVLLAGSARSGKDILVLQAAITAEMLPGPVRMLLKLFRTDVAKVQAKRIARLEATTEDTVRIQLVKVNAKWFREFMAYNPAHDFPKIRIPLLAITGEKDLQLPAADIAAMADLAGGPIETHTPADLTHLLRQDPKQPKLRDYKRQMAQPTDAATMLLVSEWVTRVAQPRPEVPESDEPQSAIDMPT